jgi:predicted dehydrogenase
VVQVGHVERFNPAVAALSDILPGLDVIAVSARRLGPPVDRDIDDGVVADLMIHDVDVVLSLVDADVASVSAVSPPDADHATATLAFADGTVADLTASRVTQRKVRRLDVVAAECLVSVDYLDQSVEIHRSSVPEYVRENGELRYRHEGVVERPLIDRREPLKRELEAFVAAATGDEPPQVTPDDAVAALELVREIEAAAASTPAASPAPDAPADGGGRGDRRGGDR